jgi:phosphotransacetylase
MIKKFTDLVTQLRSKEFECRIAVVAAHDGHTIEAISRAVQDGLVRPVLLGEPSGIRSLLREYNCPPGKVEIVATSNDEEAAQAAAEMVRKGEVNSIMKGRIETGVIMKILVNRETGIRKRDTMSLLAFMESPHYHKVFSITDVGLLTYPTLIQKQQAIENAIDAYAALGIQDPKIAVLAAVEKINPKMKESVEAGELREKAASGEISGCILEGPISYDLAMDRDSASIKEYTSPVAGEADILVVPDISAGNLLAKSLTITGGAKTCGVVLGALVPLIITSRSASVEDKYMSVILSVLIGSVQGETT